MTGKVYGIGVGPGDPELITVKAFHAIEQCDLLVFPTKQYEESYAYRVVSAVYPKIQEKELLGVSFPMTKDERILTCAHREIYEMIDSHRKKGKTIGILTIGDPTIYATYMYLHRQFVAEGYCPEIINGIPSFTAVAARLGISLGEKNQEIHIIPASYDVAHALSYSGTKVFMKSGKALEKLKEALRKMGDKITVMGVSNCGLESERVFRNLEEMQVEDRYLITVIVKEKE